MKDKSRLILPSEYIKSDGSSKNLNEIYSERIITTEKIRIGINNSSDIYQIANLAVLGMSLMLGDMLFFESNKYKLYKNE